MKKIAMLMVMMAFASAAFPSQSNKTFEIQLGNNILGDLVSIRFVWCNEISSIGENHGGFWISTTELTRMQFEVIMGDNFECTSSEPFTSGYSFFQSDLPMNNLGFKDAQLIVDLLNLDKSISVSLPSKSQWVAALAPSRNKYSTCTISDYGWVINTSGGRVHPVMMKRPNNNGLYDMIGNVEEIVTTSALPFGARLTKDNTIGIGGDYRSSAVWSTSSQIPISKEPTEGRGVRLCVRNICSPTFKDGYHKWQISQAGRESSRCCNMCHDEEKVAKIEEWSSVNDVKIAPCVSASSPYNHYVWRCDVGALPKDHMLSAAKVASLYNYFHRVRAEGEELDAAWHNLKLSADFQFDGNESVEVTRTVPIAISVANRTLSRLSKDYVFWEQLRLNGKLLSQMYADYIEDFKYASEMLWIAKRRIAEQVTMHRNKEKKRQEREERRKRCNTPESIYDLYRDCFAIISIGGSTGSGFIVRDNGAIYLYTNRHVVDAKGKARITVSGNKNIRCGKIEYAKNMDIVRAKVVNPGVINSEILEFNYNSPKLDEKLMVIGNSDGLGVQTIGKGAVLGISNDETIIEISAEIVSGNSGGAVLDSSGKVIGVATFALKSENDWIKAGTRYSRARRFALRPQGNAMW